MDNQNTSSLRGSLSCQFVLILVLMDNQNTDCPDPNPDPDPVLILVLMDNQNTFNHNRGNNLILLS